MGEVITYRAAEAILMPLSIQCFQYEIGHRPLAFFTACGSAVVMTVYAPGVSIFFDKRLLLFERLFT